MKSKRNEPAQFSMTKSIADGDIDKLYSVLEKGGSANTTDKYGRSALMQAINSNTKIKLDIIKLLIFYRADVNKEEGETHTVPLIRAIELQDWRIVELLLASGADINHVYLGGDKTLFMEAMAKKQYEIAKKLIEYGALLAIPNKVGNTTLHLAILERQEEIAALILQKAPRDLLLYTNRQGETPLYLAAVVMEEKGIVEKLLQVDAPDLPNQRGITAENAARNNEIKTLIRKAREAKELSSYLQAVERAQETILNKEYPSRTEARKAYNDLAHVTVKSIENNIRFITQNGNRFSIDFQKDVPSLIEALTTLLTWLQKADVSTNNTTSTRAYAPTLFNETEAREQTKSARITRVGTRNRL